MQRQGATAIATGAVAVVLTLLSLSHLARGVELVTDSPSLEAWAMAIGVDLCFVTAEISQLAISEKLRRHVGAYAHPAICGTLIAWPS